MTTADSTIDSWETVNWYSETGEQLLSEKIGNLAEKLEHVYQASWQSEWSPNDEHFQDFIRIVRTPEGYWGSFRYECSGYSSYTYEPIEVLSVIKSTDFEKFWNLVLTDNETDYSLLRLNSDDIYMYKVGDYVKIVDGSFYMEDFTDSIGKITRISEHKFNNPLYDYYHVTVNGSEFPFTVEEISSINEMDKLLYV